MWSYLISSMLFSNVISIYNSTSWIILLTLLLLLTVSMCSSKDAEIVRILFSCSIYFDGNVFVVSFITLLLYDRCSFYDLGLTSSFKIFLDYSYSPLSTDSVHHVFFQIFHVTYEIFDQINQTWLGVCFQSNLLTQIVVVV